MCSRRECEDRIRTGECSIFERRSEDSLLDPRRAVSKYRRSAAGADQNHNQRVPRTLRQLETTVRYLLELLVHFDHADPQQQQQQQRPFLSLVGFVEDRMRAVQVDLTKSNTGSKTIQRQAARCQILILYLLVDCRSGSTSSVASSISNQKDVPNNKNNKHHQNQHCYERKFGLSALQTALSNYWYDNHTGSNAIMDDEILSLSILVQLNEQLQSLQEIASTGMDADDPSNMPRMPALCFGLSELYRKHHPQAGGTRAMADAATAASTTVSSRPLLFWHWTLQLVSLIAMGHWQTALHRLLLVDPNDDSSFFRTLAQCCLAPSLDYLRWKALQTWNAALGTPPLVQRPQLRNEGLSGSELQRLLGLASPASALEFVAGVSLPVDDDRVRFKQVKAIRPLRPPTSRSHIISRIRKDADAVVLAGSGTLRTSAEGLAIPSVEWMRQFLLLDG